MHEESLVDNLPPRIVSYCLVVLMLSGCVAHRQYRTDYSECRVGGTQSCDAHALQRWSNGAEGSYLLGFVEFDDQGQAWDRDQTDAVMDAISLEAAQKDVLLVVFVHGWKHSAAPGDTNIRTFQDALAKLSAADARLQREANAPARQVVGVYLGWRGGSVSMPGIKELTFWERKNTAHKVGHGSVTEVLSRLELIKRTRNVIESANNSRLVVVGHSFGGAVVYAAVGQILANRFVHTEGPIGLQSNVPGYGDLVVLINPAFEATLFASLSDMSTERGTYFKSQLPLLAVLTSEADDATKRAFPLGRWLSTLFEKTHVMERHNPVTKDNERVDGDAANITAIGHFAPYRTHTLRANDERESTEVTPVDPDQVAMQSRVASTHWADDSPGSAIPFGEVTLRRSDSSAGRNPYIVAYVDPKLIRDHNHIDDPRIVEFISQLILISTQSSSQLEQTLESADKLRSE
jgi:hypothetical protein